MGQDRHGLRWQSEAATPLWRVRRIIKPLPARKRRGTSFPAAVHDTPGLCTLSSHPTPTLTRLKSHPCNSKHRAASLTFKKERAARAALSLRNNNNPQQPISSSLASRLCLLARAVFLQHHLRCLDLQGRQFRRGDVLGESFPTSRIARQSESL